jgi:putative two-component system response regulator
MEALSVAHESHPDLILLDMMLPKLDGPSVLRALKADPLTAQIPVAVVTGLSQKNEEKLWEFLGNLAKHERSLRLPLRL